MNCIYVDGSYCPLSGKAGIGIPYKNIAQRIKAKDSLAAELIAVIRGITFATQRLYIIKTDCMVIVNAVKTRRLIIRHEELCLHMYVLLDRHKHVRIEWIKREKNRKADSLARRGRLIGNGRIV